eukprot:m.229749 g.229749  ORF g.229749 m.229749 type:complete len:92 (-) comp17056_c6_seq1:115-390(-)
MSSICCFISSIFHLHKCLMTAITEQVRLLPIFLTFCFLQRRKDFATFSFFHFFFLDYSTRVAFFLFCVVIFFLECTLSETMETLFRTGTTT